MPSPVAESPPICSDRRHHPLPNQVIFPIFLQLLFASTPS
jgi:hypothetical protein